MDEKDKVIVVTVTYNSSNYLKRLLKSLRRSDYHIFKIIIVDNNSNKSHANAIDNMCKEYLECDLLRLKNNLGGAGGFEEGVKYAIKNYSCDWIWLMDDDAFPRTECLSNLLKYKNLDNVGCLAPIIYGVEWKKFQLYHHKRVTKYLNDGVALTDDLSKIKNCVKFDTDAFVGPLIRARVIKDIGYPDGSLFIYGDDREYTYRLTRKYDMYLIKDAIINHRDTMDNDIGIWKTYYKYRNKFLFINKYKKGNISEKIGKILVFKEMMIDLLKVIIKNKYKNNKIKYVKYMNKALIDGLNNKTGKVVDPANF